MPSFDDIFRQFYENVSSSCLDPEKARRFIEDEMIRSGQRIALDAIICREYLSETCLKTLADSKCSNSSTNL